MKSLLSLILGFSWLLAACDDGKSPSPSASPGAPSAAASALKATKVAAAPEPMAAKKPRTKPFKETSAKKLGTLADGVGLAVGKTVPELSAKDSQGQAFSLQAAAQKTPLLLMFYRGGWCPFCNHQVRLMTESYPEFKKRGVTPVMISVDQVSEAAKTQASYEIPFPVLSDPDLKWHEAFRVVNAVDAATVARLGGMGIDLEAHSGKKHHKIAIPSIFLIDKQGVVRFAHADEDYKVRPGAGALLEALDGALKP